MLFENVTPLLVSGDNYHFPLIAAGSQLHFRSKPSFPLKSCGKANFCHKCVLIICRECCRVTLISLVSLAVCDVTAQ